jgi:hypothetical protein
MAADLTADLNEAEAEGASAEDVLGRGAFDPRSFAASWAAERGVIPPPPPPGTRPKRPLIHLALAALVLLAATGAALAIFASPHETAPALFASRPHPQVLPRTIVAPAVGSGVDFHRVGLILLIVAIVGITLSLLFLFWSSQTGPGHRPRRRAHIDHSPSGPGSY